MTGVSVILPVHRDAPWLTPQLAAIGSQVGRPPFELVLVLNRTTLSLDAGDLGLPPEVSVKIVRADQRAGAAYARNVGIARSTGELLLFCDSDDVVAGTWIAEHTKALQSADISIGVFQYLSTEHHPNDHPSLRVPVVGSRPVASGGNCGYRSRVLSENGGFDEALLRGQDADLSLRAENAGYTVALAPAALVLNRRAFGLAGVRKSYLDGTALWTLKRRHTLPSVSGLELVRSLASSIRHGRGRPGALFAIARCSAELAGYSRAQLSHVVSVAIRGRR